MRHVVFVSGMPHCLRESIVGPIRALASPADDFTLVDASFLVQSWLAPMRIEAAIAKHPDWPLLLVYDGHGTGEHWAFTDKNFLGCLYPHDELVDAIRRRRAPTLVVDQSCHSHELAAAAECGGLDPALCGLIMASGDDAQLTTGGSLLPCVMKAFHARRPYQIIEERIMCHIGLFSDVVDMPDEDGVMHAVICGPLGGSVEISVPHAQQTRWGAVHDPLFYPA